MKSLSRLEIILVAITCLILLTFIKLNMGDDKTATHDVIGSEHVTKAHELGSYPAQNTQVQKTLRPKPNAVTDIANDLMCDESCKDQISNALASNGLLSADMIARIRENPGAFSKELMNAPAIISPLLATLKADEEDDNCTQNATLAILKALSDQDKLDLANILTSYEADQDRIMGLELLELSLETQTGSIQTLNKVLETEGDNSVLSKAIRITSNLPEDTDVQNTLQALKKIIQYNPSDHISGSALLAKVNLAPDSNSVYEDISASLESISSDKAEIGLTALETAFNRDGTEFTSVNKWYEDISLRESVRSIAQNQDLSEDIRSHAYHILNSYFIDD